MTLQRPTEPLLSITTIITTATISAAAAKQTTAKVARLPTKAIKPVSMSTVTKKGKATKELRHQNQTNQQIIPPMSYKVTATSLVLPTQMTRAVKTSSSRALMTQKSSLSVTQRQNTSMTD